MKICIATCSNLPDWERDDQPVFQLLDEARVNYQIIPWDQTGVDWAQFDACLIRTTWDYMDRKDEFVAWADGVERQTQLFNPASVVRWNTDKHYLQALEAEGVEIAPTIWLNGKSEYDLERLMNSRQWGRGFLKPTVGASARETFRFDRASQAEAQGFLDRVLSKESMMLQPYLKSVETEGELSAIYFDGQFSHAVQKIPVPGDYRVQDDYGASDFAVEMMPELRAKTDATLSIARTMLNLEETLLYARIDYIRLDSGRYVLNELELVEPSLFLRHSAGGASRLVEALLRRV